MHWIYAHLIGDFIFQNDWMALHKKERGSTGFFRCTVHAVLYIIPFFLCELSALQLLLIAGQHWVIDRYNFVPWFMRVKGQNEFATGVCYPWSQITMDQILHILWIALVVRYA